MKNDSIQSTLFVLIDTELSFDNSNPHDLIKMSVPATDTAEYQYFKLMVDRRNISDDDANWMNSLVIFDPEVEILGHKFFNTYHLKNENPDNSHLIYYNYANGIVSFVDPERITWIFDRFE